MSTLRIEGVRTRAGGPVDLTIDAGECVSLGGPSGAGKTLLLRAIVDLDPHAGRVLLEGCECGSVSAPVWRRRVGMLPSESQWWHDDVGAHFGATEETALAALGFAPDVVRWPVARLSTGERQRLALLRLLTNRPRALLLDEPTANLDAANVARVEALVAEYRRDASAAVLWVAHDAEQRRRVAARHVEMQAGALVAGGPPWA